MPFSTKQSDVFYNDETKEMVVCAVSAITAARCESGDTIYGSLPIIYKIDKDTNYKQVVYPPNLATFQTDENSDLYNLTPECPVEGLNFNSITKPLVNFNKSTSRYSVTFLGRFASDVDGLVINNYIFEDIDNRFHLLKAKALLPQESLSANGRYTFDSGYINSNLYTGGNTIRNKSSSWFNPADGPEVERSPNYMIPPTYVESTSALGFNLMQDYTDTAFDALTGDKNFPFMYGGSYISVNPKYVAFDPEHTIRIDFRARAFTSTAAPSAYGSTQSVGTSASRWIQQYSPTGAGEGFCVYFYKQPTLRRQYVVPNGVSTTLGYSPADFNVVETAGSAQTTVGLFKRDHWTPYTGMDSGANIGDGENANSFLGVGFDIGGNFATTSEDKPGWYNSVAGSTHTASPCSVAVRGNRFTDCKVLSSVELSAVNGATAIPLHTSASNAVFVDYRIDLSNKGNRLTVYHKLTSSTDYNTIMDLRLNKVLGSVGSGTEYNPWAGFNVDPIDENYPLLNVGLSFTTSTKISQFELHSFEVKGVKIHRPWDKKEKDTETTDRVDYVNKSSENLRERLMNKNLLGSENNENINVEMVIPAKAGIANDIYEENNTTEITLCSDNEPDKIEEEVEVKYTGIRPETIDKVIQATERGDLIPEIGGNPIPIRIGDEGNDSSYEEEIDTEYVQVLPEGFTRACRTAGALGQDGQSVEGSPSMWLYEQDLEYDERKYVILVRGIETDIEDTTTLHVYKNNIKALEEMWLKEVHAKGTKDNEDKPYKYWELHVTSTSLPNQGAGSAWNSVPDQDYSSNFLEWSWTPKLNNNGNAWVDDDYEEWKSAGDRPRDYGVICQVYSPSGPEDKEVGDKFQWGFGL